MQKGHCAEGCAEGVRGGSECKKVIARGAEGCAEGLSAKRSLRGGVRRGVGRV